MYLGSFINQYKKPIHIVYKNAVQEITIYFKPIGIHHFVSNQLLLMNESNNSLNLFEDFDSTMIAIFKIDNRDQQIEYLEKYWISKLNQKNELLRLEKIIQDIEKGEKIELIARKHNLSRQYINKIFSKYLGKNPTEYRRIHRFRKAIFTYKNEKKLTNLSYENLYFDQAHFNKDFKNFTNINPKLFFNHIDSEKPVIWFYAQ
ncbi:hypothetical protein CHU92_00355 [Flavobacterium cyanobacteriorum]|uniref:HTH araC/xylS-type domain-containing protein n=2 Tax=Flavobacterium cyanobacteriorum TaxID=2022802 RepID=A0A256A801_9FLAO|nr:hypothetical protein CHU92_00355 [Flavobacterium cyanobacteriorum]